MKIISKLGISLIFSFLVLVVLLGLPAINRFPLLLEQDTAAATSTVEITPSSIFRFKLKNSSGLLDPSCSANIQVATNKAFTSGRSVAFFKYAFGFLKESANKSTAKLLYNKRPVYNLYSRLKVNCVNNKKKFEVSSKIKVLNLSSEKYKKIKTINQFLSFDAPILTVQAGSKIGLKIDSNLVSKVSKSKGVSKKTIAQSLVLVEWAGCDKPDRQSCEIAAPPLKKIVAKFSTKDNLECYCGISGVGAAANFCWNGNALTTYSNFDQVCKENILSTPGPTAVSTRTVAPAVSQTAIPNPSPTRSATSTVTPNKTSTPIRTATPTTIATANPTTTATITPTSPPIASRVLIVSIDGLRPDVISLAPMSNLQSLIQSSAYSLNAQTILPSITLPSHCSMLTGLCPSKHGVLWNEYDPNKGYANGVDLFDIAHASNLNTYMHVGKEKFRHITEPSSLNSLTIITDTDTVVADKLIENFPQDFGVLFVHFPSVDVNGHAHGWLSTEQLSAATQADLALKKILTELSTRNLLDNTLIIVTADHGGHGSGHGTSMPEDMTIPWIASGPGIQAKQLTTVVHTMDTAATAAFALGLSRPSNWDGVPVYEAFGLPIQKTSVACQ